MNIIYYYNVVIIMRETKQYTNNTIFRQERPVKLNGSHKTHFSHSDQETDRY